MRDDLLFHYERELTYIRRLGAEFAKKYPKVAARLQLEPGKCEDPHVERLLEGFAFLTARVQLRLEDDFPQVTEALLDVVYPNYVRPVPSMSIVQFELDPEQGKLSSGFPVPRGTMLHSRPVGGVPCKFRTCYDATLWPLSVAESQCMTPDRLKPAVKLNEAVAAIRLDLRCLPDVSFGQTGPHHAQVLSERRGAPGFDAVRAAGQQLHPDSGPGPVSHFSPPARGAASLNVTAGGVRPR